MIRRSVLEWQRIPYGEGEQAIPERAADRLVAVARRSHLGGEGGADILSEGRHHLRAGQVVGVVAAEDCSLEILPKIDGLGDATNDSGRSCIRRQLIHMLAVALDIEVDSGRITELGWQRDNLLEILIGLFARKLADAVRLGLPRRYVGHEDDLPTLRGRLDLTRQFTTLAATPQWLACRYDALSPDMALNQIMKAAVARLVRVSRQIDNQRTLRELALAYADIRSVPVTELRWDAVVLDRTNLLWRELISLAKLLLGERFQTTSAGEAQGFSLLFEMNTLFEEYVARMLAKGLANHGLSVRRQGGRRYCLEDVDSPGRRHFQTRPDILVSQASDTLLVIDTKWKRLCARVDDPKQGISQADIYQMLAYSRLYRCRRLMLLYPHHADLGCAEPFTRRFRVTGSDDELVVATLDVGISKDIAERLSALVRPHIVDTVGMATA